ncbi:PREDICTED: uncharacterized protein LOC105556716 [Vollenhovia emeryi]|uniref:uncharacterized protein LOC105556716 n=1 Tax=Vollenhovia emeryi TaxID=411798 RepID=UPI0005F4A245|nr:PREDICTED: uncharacterized protein LOC105556716 [Vollenhovia emeryi]
MFIGNFDDYFYKESLPVQVFEDTLGESSAINETDSTQCQNTETERICCTPDILLEPKIKLQRLSQKDIVKLKNRQVLKSIENSDIKSQESKKQRSKRKSFSIRQAMNRKAKLRVKILGDEH